MSKKGWFYIIFFIVLIGAFYLSLVTFIPAFGQKKLPVLSYIQPFAFTNQEGKVITNRDVQGKVYVAEYFFTTCKGICPKLNKNMQVIYKHFQNEPDFRILSHTVDPEVDNVPAMKAYAEKLGADPNTWWFLTGTKDSLYNAARVSYLLDDPHNSFTPISQQFLHTQFFALVDREGKVRKIYDGLKEEDLKSLERDIIRLLDEKPGNSRFFQPQFKRKAS